MAVETEKLLALKAFYMGHSIAAKRILKDSALAMISAAIDHLKYRTSQAEKIRLAFYHMLRAEVLRYEGSPIEDRKMAKTICDSIGSPLYSHFLAVEDATQSRKKLKGIQTLYVVDEGIKRIESYWAGDGWNLWEIRYDIASHALGVNRRDLTEKQKKFLEKVSLIDLLEAHGVQYAP